VDVIPQIVGELGEARRGGFYVAGIKLGIGEGGAERELGGINC